MMNPQNKSAAKTTGTVSDETPPSYGKTAAPGVFSRYLDAFADCQPLRRRVLIVLHALPQQVQRDFLNDPRFHVAMQRYEPGKGWRLWMAAPAPHGGGSRSVVLHPRLADCSKEFACYVIAHEFAHAYLRNGRWGDITDAEQAADALAASWGFARPSDSMHGDGGLERMEPR